MRIGIDIVSIERFAPLLPSEYPRWKKIFSEAEWRRAFQDKNAAAHLAALFAAKEAAMKAEGLIGPFGYRAFEISHDDSGAPHLNRVGASISITHTHDIAAAVCIMV